MHVRKFVHCFVGSLKHKDISTDTFYEDKILHALEPIDFVAI